MSKKLTDAALQEYDEHADLRTGDNHYETHIVPDPARPYICHIAHAFAMPHWHENIEILYFHGNASVICDRASYEVEAHDIAVLAPGTLHALPKCPGATHDCLIIDGAFLSKSNINTADLKFECIIRDKRTAELYRAVIAEIARMDMGDQYGAASVKAAMLTLMVHICREYSSVSDAEYGRSDAIKRAIRYIKAHYSRPLTVDMVASSANISKYYFCREFHRETGFTVVRYINNLRCREAEKLLRTGKHTVGEVARMCGFENLSYFTRTYKAIIGKTPSRTRE